MTNVREDPFRQRTNYYPLRGSTRTKFGLFPCVLQYMNLITHSIATFGYGLCAQSTRKKEDKDRKTRHALLALLATRREGSASPRSPRFATLDKNGKPFQAFAPRPFQERSWTQTQPSKPPLDPNSTFQTTPGPNLNLPNQSWIQTQPSKPLLDPS